MQALFAHVLAERVKIRVMFTQNSRMHDALVPNRTQETYFKLYYQFIKHTFGLRYAGRDGEATRVRLLLDQLPDSGEQASQFRGYIGALSHWRAFRDARVFIDPHQMAEVRSHDHVLLQCLDVVIGAMQFRLNNKHLEIPAGSRRRGKRTIAKERVYRVIQQQLHELRPHFNFGITTGCDGDFRNRWRHLYRHWLSRRENHATNKKPRDGYGFRRTSRQA